ncbi:hypothetical protein Q5O12_27630, partial [Klebsiella pneumoniae]|uniref:hypothetical protein n=1 Tax=Klebsiella pneumoniae TaxID=573 RepID=UPI0027319EEB
ARAGELCRGVLKSNPRFAAALVLLGDLARREGQATEAIGFYRRAQELEPQNIRLREVLAGLEAGSPAAVLLDGLEEKARALV